MGKKHIRISDHACLRYAERVLGFDRKSAQAELIRLVGAAVELCPDCRVPFSIGGEEYVAIVRNRTVLTIVPRSEMRLPSPPKRPKALRPAKEFTALEHILNETIREYDYPL